MVDGELHRPLVAAIERAKDRGIDVILWSARGRRYAQMVAERHGISDHFTAVLGKPGFIVDDKGWSWIKYTHALASHAEVDAISGAEGACQSQ